jgi:hypothetical protein
MAAETTRDTIWLQKPRGIQYSCQNHEGYIMASVPRGIHMAAETMRDSISLPKPRGKQFGCRTTRDTKRLPNRGGYNMAAETTRDTIWLPKPQGIQYGCRNHEGYNMAADEPGGKQYGCRTKRDGRSPVGTTKMFKMFILPCRKLDEEEVEGQKLSQWLLSLCRLGCCLIGRHS